jgi:transcriptional regulator with GAF, ATPase, and Fis domain
MRVYRFASLKLTASADMGKARARPDRKRAAGRTILTGDIVNIEGKPIGTIGVIRERPGRFSDAQVELLRTFADQAVIAIENVRLFTELEARNAELTDALARQTATAEVLSVSKRPRHHRGQRNHFPEAPMTTGAQVS